MGVEGFGEKLHDRRKPEAPKMGNFEKQSMVKGEISVNKNLWWTLVWLLMDTIYRLHWSEPRACFGGFEQIKLKRGRVQFD